MVPWKLKTLSFQCRGRVRSLVRWIYAATMTQVWSNKYIYFKGKDIRSTYLAQSNISSSGSICTFLLSTRPITKVKSQDNLVRKCWNCQRRRGTIHSERAFKKDLASIYTCRSWGVYMGSGPQGAEWGREEEEKGIRPDKKQSLLIWAYSCSYRIFILAKTSGASAKGARIQEAWRNQWSALGEIYWRKG